MTNSSRLEEQFYWHVLAMGLPEPVRQYRIPESKRRFVYDFAWPDKRLLVEVQGGVWVANTGHTSGRGITRDCAKVNEAVLQGWRVLLFTADMVTSGEADEMLEGVLNGGQG